MTFNAIVLKMMRENYKQYLLYVGCNAFAILFLFLFFSIYFNQTIEQMKESHSFDTVLAIPTAALVLFMFFFIQYAHQMFIKKRNHEFGILLAIGMTPNNIIRLLVTESMLVAGVSLLLGLVFGSVFSKIFFYVFTYFSSLTPELYHLSFNMFGYTAAVYMIIFCVTIAMTVFYIRTKTSITIMHSKQVIDHAKTTHALFGVIGFTCIIVSILGVFLTYRTHDELLLLWAALTFFGLYLFLANIVHTLIYFIKGSPTFYYRFILLFSSLEQKQKKLTSLLTLTSVMIMITTLYFTITLVIAKEEYTRFLTMNPSDVAFLSEQGTITEDELHAIFNEENGKLNEVRIIPFLQLEEGDYYGYPVYSNVLSLSEYEGLTGKEVELQSNECLVLMNQPSEFEGQPYNICEINSHSYDAVYTEEKQFVTQITNSNVYMVVPDADWHELKESLDLQYQYHLFLGDWQQSLLAVEQLRNSQAELHFDAESFTSKIEIYTRMSEENSILFYIMSFLSILFYFGAFILLYLNFLADIDLEKAKFLKLFKIGITKKELKRQFNVEIALLFFIPTFIGISLALFYLIGMTAKSNSIMTNREILSYFLGMSGIYFMIQVGFYIYVKAKLFRKVWDVG